MIIENIEKKIKVALVVSIASIVAGVVVASMGMIYGYSLASKNADQIYVLSEGIPEVAHRSTREEMIGIEAKSVRSVCFIVSSSICLQMMSTSTRQPRRLCTT